MININNIIDILLKEKIIQYCKVQPKTNPKNIVLRPTPGAPVFLKKDNWNNLKIYIMRKYPETEEFLKQFDVALYNSFAEIVYCLNNNLIEIPKCPICGKNCQFNFKHYKHRLNCYEYTCGNSSCEIELNKNNLDPYLEEYISLLKTSEANSEIVEKIFRSEGILCNTAQIRYDGNYQFRLNLKTWSEVEAYIKNKYFQIDFEKWFNTFDNDPNKIITAIKFNLKDQPKCPYCEENRSFKSVNDTLEECYFPTCGSHDCIIKEKTKTSLKNWGTSHPMQNPEVLNKLEQINLIKYGFPCTLQNEEVKEKGSKTNIIKYGVPVPTQNPEVLEKTKKTNLERRGCEWPMQSPEVKILSSQTCRKNYNCDWPTQIPFVIEKKKETFFKNFGVPYGHSIEVNKKRAQTNIERYGAPYIFQTRYFREKSKTTCQEKYGTDSPMQVKEIFNKTFHKYKYKDINFDSSWELAYYIWCEDHNIKLIRNPEPLFFKDSKNINHAYYPDFKIGNIFIEIKGNHFLDEKGNIISPYTWDNNEKQNNIRCYKTLLIKKLLKSKKLKIFTEENIKFIINWVKHKYGKDYLKSFSTKKQKEK